MTVRVEYTEEDEARDGVCVRVIFCDFSVQERLRPVLKGGDTVAE